MSLRTNLTVILAIEVVRTDGFTMTAAAHGIDANEQDAIARYVAFNAADGKVVFEQCGYKWRSSPWRDSLFIHYLEEPSKRITLVFVLLWTGDKDAALKELIEIHQRSMMMNVHYVRTEAEFAPFHGDPRFEAFLADPKNNATRF